MKTTLKTITVLALITLGGIHSLLADNVIKTIQAQRQQESFRKQGEQTMKKILENANRVSDNNRAVIQRNTSISRPSYTPSYRPSFSGRR